MQWAVLSMLCKVLYNIDKQARFLSFYKLFKISENKLNWILLRVLSTSFICKSDIEQQTKEKFLKT